jgi:hypothetical protein
MLLAFLAEQRFSDSFLDSLPSSIATPVDAHHLVFVVIEVVVQEFWDDVRVSERSVT